MNTRKRAAFLKKLGYRKCAFALARGCTTYRHDASGTMITLRNGADAGGHFICTGSHPFVSALLQIGNTSSNAYAEVAELNYVYPDLFPDINSYDEIGALVDDLFTSFSTFNVKYHEWAA